jgi:hypothetical protein
MNLNNTLKIFSLTALFFLDHAYASSFTPFDETQIQAPYIDSNEQSLQSELCRTRQHSRWDYCSITNDFGEEQMNRFTFTNWGENKIVVKSQFGVGRDFEFLFESYARSDLGMLIWDAPDQFESHGHLKLMKFFPRLVMPAIRYIADLEKDIMIVTLPTREEVVFDSQSKVIIGGVLNEAPIKQDVEGNALIPDVTYTGSGVVVEANRLNDYPVGFSQKSKNNMATIKKKGHKDCKILAKKLWYTDYNKNGNVFFNKKYSTDKAFDTFLKKECKFSIY